MTLYVVAAKGGPALTVDAFQTREEAERVLEQICHLPNGRWSHSNMEVRKQTAQDRRDCKPTGVMDLGKDH
jgi:hypothetical protein